MLEMFSILAAAGMFRISIPTTFSVTGLSRLLKIQLIITCCLPVNRDSASRPELIAITEWLTPQYASASFTSSAVKASRRILPAWLMFILS